MMLFLDTSDPEQTSLFLLDKSAMRAHAWPSARSQSETLAPEIRKFMKKAAVSMSDLDSVGVVTGPGFFSRIRTGVVTANALGFALGIPVVGVKKGAAGIDFAAVVRQKGKRAVAPYYDRAPNISKPKKRTVK